MTAIACELNRSMQHSYRANFMRRAEVVYLHLLGGDKSSQKRDIIHAIEMARTLDKE